MRTTIAYWWTLFNYGTIHVNNLIRYDKDIDAYIFIQWRQSLRKKEKKTKNSRGSCSSNDDWGKAMWFRAKKNPVWPSLPISTTWNVFNMRTHTRTRTKIASFSCTTLNVRRAQCKQKIIWSNTKATREINEWMKRDRRKRRQKNVCVMIFVCQSLVIHHRCFHSFSSA